MPGLPGLPVPGLPAGLADCGMPIIANCGLGIRDCSCGDLLLLFSFLARLLAVLAVDFCFLLNLAARFVSLWERMSLFTHILAFPFSKIGFFPAVCLLFFFLLLAVAQSRRSQITCWYTVPLDVKGIEISRTSSCTAVVSCLQRTISSSEGKERISSPCCPQRRGLFCVDPALLCPPGSCLRCAVVSAPMPPKSWQMRCGAPHDSGLFPPAYAVETAHVAVQCSAEVVRFFTSPLSPLFCAPYARRWT